MRVSLFDVLAVMPFDRRDRLLRCFSAASVPLISYSISQLRESGVPVIVCVKFSSCGNDMWLWLLLQGKFVRIHFGTNGKIAGADIESCLYSDE